MTIFIHQPAEADAFDTWIDSANATTNYGTGATMRTGITTPPGGTEYYRALLKPTLTSIPKGAYIVSAKLELVVSGATHTITQNFSLYRVKRAMVEAQATWNIFSTGNNWAAAGCSAAADYDTTPLGAVSVGPAPSGTYTITLDRALFQTLINRTFTYQGFLLKGAEALASYVDWHSASAASSANRPKWTITYSNRRSAIIY